MKILCPFHNEVTPSLEIYGETFYCFGCGESGPTSSLPGNLGKLYSEAAAPKPIEDLASTVKYIGGLDKMDIRGLSLPCDGKSYYILWPDHSYYNRRFFDTTTRSKYKTPSGHQRPLYEIRTGFGSKLAIVEGELNALSVYESTPKTFDIVSPGAASEFYSKKIDKHLTKFLKYDEIYLFADEDEAGAIACIELKTLLMRKHPKVFIHLMKQDFNDILVNYGKKAVEEEVCKTMGLPGGLQSV